MSEPRFQVLNDIYPTKRVLSFTAPFSDQSVKDMKESRQEVIILLDSSGSMSSCGKYKNATEAICYVAAQLGRICVIKWDKYVGKTIHIVSPNAQTTAKNLLASYEGEFGRADGGGTDINCVFDTVVAEVRRLSKSPVLVVVLTDGATERLRGENLQARLNECHPHVKVVGAAIGIDDKARFKLSEAIGPECEIFSVDAGNVDVAIKKCTEQRRTKMVNVSIKARGNQIRFSSVGQDSGKTNELSVSCEVMNGDDGDFITGMVILSPDTLPLTNVEVTIGDNRFIVNLLEVVAPPYDEAYVHRLDNSATKDFHTRVKGIPRAEGVLRAIDACAALISRGMFRLGITDICREMPQFQEALDAARREARDKLETMAKIRVDMERLNDPQYARENVDRLSNKVTSLTQDTTKKDAARDHCKSEFKAQLIKCLCGTYKPRDDAQKARLEALREKLVGDTESLDLPWELRQILPSNQPVQNRGGYKRRTKSVTTTDMETVFGSHGLDLWTKQKAYKESRDLSNTSAYALDHERGMLSKAMYTLSNSHRNRGQYLAQAQIDAQLEMAACVQATERSLEGIFADLGLGHSLGAKPPENNMDELLARFACCSLTGDGKECPICCVEAQLVPLACCQGKQKICWACVETLAPTQQHVRCPFCRNTLDTQGVAWATAFFVK